MSIEVLEIILVATIIAIQLIVFWVTFLKIGAYKRLIPETADIEVVEVELSANDLVSLSTQDIADLIENSLRNASAESDRNNHKNEIGNAPAPENYSEDGEPVVAEDENDELDSSSETSSTDEWISVNVLNHKTLQLSTFVVDILNPINRYLVRNRNSTTEFQLFKEVVERRSDGMEDDISSTIAIPLYLGLMGTMAGIVIGLFNMSELSNLDAINLSAGAAGSTADSIGQGITVLLAGVKIAMIASLMGLFLTIINSGWYFKSAKNVVDTRKHRFYTFIQTELLPVVNESMGATFEMLQRNLIRFNSEFSGNLGRLSSLFDKNFETLEIQERVLSKVSRSRLAETMNFNANVLSEMNKAMKEFGRFNETFQNLNDVNSNSIALADKISTVLDRTSAFEKIASAVDSRLEESKHLMEFLKNHFSELDERKQIITHTVIQVDDAISDAIGQLKEHTYSSIQKVKQFTVEEVDSLKNALTSSRTNLNNLEYLEVLKKDVSDFKLSSASQGERIKLQLETLNKGVSELTSLVNRATELQLKHQKKASFFRFWKKKRKKDEK